MHCISACRLCGDARWFQSARPAWGTSSQAEHWNLLQDKPPNYNFDPITKFSYLCAWLAWFPVSNDITVDLPEPCSPMTPITKKSLWSCKVCNEIISSNFNESKMLLWMWTETNHDAVLTHLCCDSIQWLDNNIMLSTLPTFGTYQYKTCISQTNTLESIIYYKHNTK